MKFNCDSIYEINPALNRLYIAEYKNDLHIEDGQGNETNDAQVFKEVFSEKWLQIQNIRSETEKRQMLCNFLKLESVFDYWVKLYENGKDVFLWNVALMLDEHVAKKYNISKISMYKNYISFVENVFNGCFNNTFESSMLYKHGKVCVPFMVLLPNGWLDCWCYVVDKELNDICINRYYDCDATFVGEIVHTKDEQVDFSNFIKTDDYSVYMNKKGLSSEVYNKAYELQKQVENGFVPEEELSLEDLTVLCSLYDNQIKNNDDEIFSLNEKIKRQHLNTLTSIFEKEFAVEKQKIHLGASIRKDFGLDENLEVEELFIAIEETFKIEVMEREMNETYLVEDLINLIISKQTPSK